MGYQRSAELLSGWGRFPIVSGQVLRSENLVETAPEATLSRGLGRSYGDASLPASDCHPVEETTLANRFLRFDDETGIVRCEAGVSLRQLNRLSLPRRWFTPVTPGTQFVTLGGMVAADVHGKNHHVAGCFGQHVRSLRLCLANGEFVECSNTTRPELFRATLGGMGLTGHVVELEFQMEKVPSPWIFSESEQVPDLASFIGALRSGASQWPFTVGWIDCLTRGKAMGRGILIKGRWAQPAEAPSQMPREKSDVSVPFQMPSWVLSPWSIRAFNTLYFRKHGPRKRRGVVTPWSFFYPLDRIHDWNLLYGKRGFTQYQCVLPQAEDNGPVRRFMEVLTASGGSSFLCVIKDCGDQGIGMLSFPRTGISIALDIAIRDGVTQALVDRLNEIVVKESGRIYLAKDALTRAEHFRAMEPRLDDFLKVRRQWDPEGRIRSAQSVRMMGDAP